MGLCFIRTNLYQRSGTHGIEINNIKIRRISLKDYDHEHVTYIYLGLANNFPILSINSRRLYVQSIVFAIIEK